MAGFVRSQDHALLPDTAKSTPPPIKLPAHYRDWKLISVAHEGGKLNDLRAVLGNDRAIDAFRGDRLPFPDGTIIARLAWAYTPSEQNNQAFGQEQSFVAGAPTNVQLMVKDSKRYASTGGWRFAQFTHGKPDGPEALKSCYSCHIPAKQRDYVFTRYAP
ncbi:cytochrome P460 family protein [Edaphobacter sp. HDX4]